MPVTTEQPLPIRMCYIGVVSLLCRAHAALGHEKRLVFDGETEMERVAEHFNAQGFALRMERSATGWSLFHSKPRVVAPRAFRCEGCGEWLDQFEVDGLDGRSHARTVRDERGDALPEICGPVRLVGANPIDPDGGRL